MCDSESAIMKLLFWPMLVISLFAQVVTSVAKWEAYPYHSVDYRFNGISHYLIMRLIAHLIVFVILWPLASICMTPPIFMGTISIKSLMRFVGLIVVILTVELVVSVIEWFYLPNAFTGGWYQGSFILFEAEGLKIFIFTASILVILWTLVARYNYKA
jgi:hypothetical protein